MRGKWTKDDNGEWVWNEFWNGHSARHYMMEHDRHKEFYQKKYPTPKEATKYIKKILRHFKLVASYEFTNNRRGHAFSGCFRNYITLPKKDISLGMICHEIAHLLAYNKWKRQMHHNRKFQTQNNRVCRWAKRYL